MWRTRHNVTERSHMPELVLAIKMPGKLTSRCRQCPLLKMTSRGELPTTNVAPSGENPNARMSSPSRTDRDIQVGPERSTPSAVDAGGLRVR